LAAWLTLPYPIRHAKQYIFPATILNLINLSSY
jgi:hypothetical protein